MSEHLEIFREFLEEMIIPINTLENLLEFSRNIELLTTKENAFIDPFLTRELKTLMITANKDQINLIMQALSEILKVSVIKISLNQNIQKINEEIQKLSSLDSSDFIKNKFNSFLVITDIDEIFLSNNSIEVLKKQERFIDILNIWKDHYSLYMGIIGIIKSPLLLEKELDWWSRKIFFKPPSIKKLKEILQEKSLPFQISDTDNIIDAAEGISYEDFIEVIDMAWNMEFPSIKNFISYLEDYPKEYSVSEIIEIENSLI